MRRILQLAPALVLLAGCAPTAPVAAMPPSSPAASASSSAAMPPDPRPTRAGQCPYLSKQEAQDANGQHVTAVKLSADQSTPACFFYRPDGSVQLSVRVYTGTSAIAKALVDKAAPVDTSNPADQPAGWKGGYQPSADGVVYAVAKAGSAVIVTSNQKQSIKARTVAEKAIAALKL
ncbi:DUF2020 domain-containing protein [Amycolatopsis sulphurea]|nr:DUF2020 domain-containing protein [Amycolatopsis sulphurea]